MANFRRQLNSNAIFPSEDDSKGSRMCEEFENNSESPLLRESRQCPGISIHYRDSFLESPRSSTPVSCVRQPFPQLVFGRSPSSSIQSATIQVHGHPFQPSLFKQYGNRFGQGERHSPVFTNEQHHFPLPINFESQFLNIEEGGGMDAEKGKNKSSTDQTDTLVSAWRECFVQFESHRNLDSWLKILAGVNKKGPAKTMLRIRKSWQT